MKLSQHDQELEDLMSKHHIKTLFIFTLLLSMYISACSRVVISQETVSSPSAATKNPVTAVANITPSASTAESPTTVAFSINSTCWPIEVLQKGQKLSGSLLFSGAFNSSFIWDLNSFRVRSISARDASVLADGHSVLGYDIGQPTVETLITPASIKPFTVPEDANGGGQDLADGKMLYRISEKELLSDYQESTGLHDKFYLIDPFTGVVTTQSVFLPFFWLPLADLFKVLEIQYSPDLHYVVYRTTPGVNGQQRFTLLDVGNNQIIWTGPNVDSNMIAAQTGMPEWMPDSKSLIYSWTNDKNGENYYLISLDGKVTEYTEFTGVELEGVGSQLLPFPSWSPDGRYMVFAAKQHDQYNSFNNYGLYIWDSREKIAYKPCLPNEVNLFPPYQVTWSFDSNHFAMQLAYQGNSPQPEGSHSLAAYSTTVVLDLSNKTIFELPDPKNRGEYSSRYGNVNYGLVGWLDWQIP
jgi:WD40-like Beta Propeller Repeat